MENVNDKELLGKAAFWQKNAIDREINYQYLDTYANLLIKLSRFNEAREVIQKATEVATKDGDDPQSVKELLSKLPQ